MQVAALRKGSKAAQDRLSQALLAKDVDSSAIAFGCSASIVCCVKRRTVTCIRKVHASRCLPKDVDFGAAGRKPSYKASGHVEICRVSLLALHVWFRAPEIHLSEIWAVFGGMTET